MAVVRTVTGDIDPGEIGITSMHEHIFIDATVWYQEPSTVTGAEHLDPDTPVSCEVRWALNRSPVILRDNLVLDDERLAVEELSYFKEVGGDCIVEVTSTGLRPNPAGLRRVSERTGLHIVAGCSFYVEPSHPEYVAGRTEDELADMIARAVTHGIDGTDVRAGIIGEVGTTDVSDQQVKVLRASARAALRTGAAVSIHLQAGYNAGEKVVSTLLQEGLEPQRIVLGHMDENLVDASTPDPNLAFLDYHRRCLEMGVYVQYDTFGSEWYWENWNFREPRDSDRVAGLAALVREGYEDRLLVAEDIWVKQCLRRYGGWGYDHLIRVVRPMLRAAGIGDAALDKIYIDNPRQVLTLADPQ